MKQQEILLTLIQGEEGREWASTKEGWSSTHTGTATATTNNNNNNDVCKWDGIGCSPDGNVTSLLLPESDLLATIPTALALLTTLEYIDLRQNLLRGNIPSELAKMTSLVSVILKDNRQLTGTLPVFVSRNLQQLDLSRNLLRGPIPPDFGQHNTALRTLELRENQLTGFLPYGFEDLTQLETISISSNLLSGTLPAYLGSMTKLSFLYLNNNFMVGTIPKTMISSSRTSLLKEVWFQNNALSGTIPTTTTMAGANASSSSGLRDLYIDGNKLTGTVPEFLCRDTLNADFFTTTTTSNKDDRNLCDSVTCRAGTVSDQGVFPCRNCNSTLMLAHPYLGQKGECDNWTETRIVNVLLRQNKQSACDYTDSVTCNTDGKVTKIVARGLGLTGTLPDELGLLRFLEELDLADNQLEGFFPSGLRFATLLTSLHIGGNKLRGILPPLVCERANQINNGTGGDCTSIACPMGTYSQKTGFGECFPCPDGGAPYLASTHCGGGGSGGGAAAAPNRNDLPQQNKRMLVPALAFLFITIAVLLACFYLIYRLHKDRQRRLQHWNKGVATGTVDGASFPHSEEVKTMIHNFRNRIRRNNKNGRGGGTQWLQNRLNRSYHYVISLAETEAVKDPPGTKSTDVTRGELDDLGWRERESILHHRDLENCVEAQKNANRLEVWEYPDPLETPLSYTSSSKSFDDYHGDNGDDNGDDQFGDNDEDDLSEWIKKQQCDPKSSEVWLDVPRIE